MCYVSFINNDISQISFKFRYCGVNESFDIFKCDYMLIMYSRFLQTFNIFNGILFLQYRVMN